MSTDIALAFKNAGYVANPALASSEFFGSAELPKKPSFWRTDGDRYHYDRVPRWQVLGNMEGTVMTEQEYLKSVGITQPKDLDFFEKRRFLPEIFTLKAAVKGIVFADAFTEFRNRQNMAEALSELDKTKGNAVFTLHGTVKGNGDGTLELIQSLAALATDQDREAIMNEEKLISLDKEPNPDMQTVRINNMDLGSISLMAGMLMPREERQTPATFLGMDFGDAFKPYNSVFTRVDLGTPDIPKAFHIKTININFMSSLSMSSGRP